MLMSGKRKTTVRNDGQKLSMTVINEVSWELTKNDTDVWAHKQCNVTFLKMIILINKSILSLFKIIKVR